MGITICWFVSKVNFDILHHCCIGQVTHSSNYQSCPYMDREVLVSKEKRWSQFLTIRSGFLGIWPRLFSKLFVKEIHQT
jgi:hypothetical protein